MIASLEKNIESVTLASKEVIFLLFRLILITKLNFQLISICQIRIDTRFHKLLEIILLIGNPLNIRIEIILIIKGNYMNSSFKTLSPSFGFQLNYLSQIKDVKNNKGNYNLLNYIANVF